MTKRQDEFLSDLPTYFWRYLNQIRWNPEIMYYPVGATFIQMMLLHSVSIGVFLWSLLQFWIVGLLCIAGITRRVDRAFQSLPLDYSGAGYGKPRWVIEKGKPLKLERLKISAAGFSEAAFVTHKDTLTSRLRLPISSIEKPSAEDSHIYVTIRKTNLPSKLLFESLDLDQVQPGEFYIGRTESSLHKYNLTQMIHMLIAGQTGSGKTSFLKQMLATLLVRTSNLHVVLIDMKGGIDFQEFLTLKNLEIATTYQDADALIEGVNQIFQDRAKIIKSERKTHWNEIDSGKLRKLLKGTGYPIGPVVVVVDELAELSRQANKSSAKSDLHEKVSKLAQLGRVTGVHLVIGTQRPDVKILPSQVKDNLSTKICFSVPTVAASNAVIGNMLASTLGNHPGRAVVVDQSTYVAQTPLLDRTKLETLLEPLLARQENQKDQESVLGIAGSAGPATAEEIDLRREK